MDPPLASLPRGRHAAPRDVVVASQRRRLLEAMAEVVAERGFLDTTVAAVIAHAGVSRRTFYELFRDREACFVAAFDAAVDDLIAAVSQAVESAGPAPLDAAKAGTECYLWWLENRPAHARTFLIEVLGAGPVALARRAAARRRFSDLIAAAYDSSAAAAGLPPRPAHIFRACTGAIDELVTAHLLEHGAAGTTSLLDAALDVEFALLLGPGRPSAGW
ncbi:MAG: TetR/AcrR family transcriptional regulator [Candidatus Dormibacteria bacterium]